MRMELREMGDTLRPLVGPIKGKPTNHLSQNAYKTLIWLPNSKTERLLVTKSPVENDIEPTFSTNIDYLITKMTAKP